MTQPSAVWQAKCSRSLEHFTHRFSHWAGSGKGFSTAIFSVIIWFCAGVYADFSIAWENLFTVFIGTITFLMVFLIQRAQNKELLALHVKLNELISSSKDADNAVITVEKRSEEEVSHIHGTYSTPHQAK